MMMKSKKALKILAIGMAAAAALTMAGCGGSDQGAKSSAPPAQKESALMQKIKKNGKIVVGTASGYPPYEFVDTSQGDKKVIGIDMELARKVADKLGVKLEVQDMNFQALLSSLTGGKVDVAIAGINPTDERRKSMDFSDNYLPTEQKVIIRKADADKYKKVEDLYGKTIGVQKSTTQEALAKEKIKDAKIVGLAHVPEVVLELKQGKVDGLVVEGIVGEQYVIFNDDLMFSDIKFPNAVKNSAAAIQKGNEDVVAIINAVIKENTDNGNFKKWTEEYSKKAVANANKK
jgi:polar amino acid transport system substrate-binding protein